MGFTKTKHKYFELLHGDATNDYIHHDIYQDDQGFCYIQKDRGSPCLAAFRNLYPKQFTEKNITLDEAKALPTRKQEGYTPIPYQIINNMLTYLVFRATVKKPQIAMPVFGRLKFDPHALYEDLGWILPTMAVDDIMDISLLIKRLDILNNDILEDVKRNFYRLRQALNTGVAKVFVKNNMPVVEHCNSHDCKKAVCQDREPADIKFDADDDKLLQVETFVLFYLVTCLVHKVHDDVPWDTKYLHKTLVLIGKAIGKEVPLALSDYIKLEQCVLIALDNHIQITSKEAALAPAPSQPVAAPTAKKRCTIM